MKCSMQCSCGNVKGSVDTTGSYNRCVCYCRSCQMFAHYLGKSEDVLDEQGGTAILQTAPSAVHFSEGQHEIRCMSLKEGGLLRWYASCCNSPICNTPPNFRMPFVGLIETCLKPESGTTLDRSFGMDRIRVHTAFAKGNPKPTASSMLRVALKIIPMLLKPRLNGSYKTTPFFSSDGSPVTGPTVLTDAEWQAVKRASE